MVIKVWMTRNIARFLVLSAIHAKKKQEIALKTVE